MTKKNEVEEVSKAPFWGAWWRIYALVLGNLLFLIVLFILFSRAFA